METRTTSRTMPAPRDDARGPLVLEAGADLVEPNDAAEAIEHRVEGSVQVGEAGEIEALEALRDVDADLRLALSEVVGDLSLRLGLAGDADGTLDGNALGIAERARGELPEAIERVGAFVLARAVRAELVERLDDLGQLLPADPGQLREARCG